PLKKNRQLKEEKAVMDHISDSFLETNVPLLVLIEAAKSGNEKEVKEYAQVFREHDSTFAKITLETWYKNTFFTQFYAHELTFGI
uniref:Uncharacterized protein n=1 Tax=Poecilia mexicana TaxID=48701 RepID=A0A3B3YTP0_9TELE